MAINLLKLKYFHAVASEESFTRAANTLHVAQPSLSKMVKELEEELGFPLFERNTRHMGLTAQGEKIFAQADKIFQEVETLEKSLGEIGKKIEGTLVMGTSDLVASELFPPVISSLLGLHPNLYPIIQTGTAHALAELVHERKMEFALLFHVPDELRETTEVTTFLSVPYDLVVSKDKLKDKRVLESFIGSREVDALSVRRFPTLEKWQKSHPHASIKVSTNCLRAHLGLVREGAGIAVLPHFLVKDDLKKGRLVKLMKNEDLVFTLKLLQRKNTRHSLNAQTFLDAFRASFIDQA